MLFSDSDEDKIKAKIWSIETMCLESETSDLLSRNLLK